MCFRQMSGLTINFNKNEVMVCPLAWIRGHVPSGVEVPKRNGPDNGLCLICETLEDSNHIFFVCVTAQFLWNCFREAAGDSWCNTNFPDLFEELHASLRLHHIKRWLDIGILAWTLWTICNRLVIHRTPLRQPSDAIYRMCGYLQLWRSLSRVTDRDAIDILITDLWALALRLAQPLPPPPPEPD